MMIETFLSVTDYIPASAKIRSFKLFNSFAVCAERAIADRLRYFNLTNGHVTEARTLRVPVRDLKSC